MDGAGQIALPVLGILAAAALTFYAVSFAELREVLHNYCSLISISISFFSLSFFCFSSFIVHIIILLFILFFVFQKSFRDLDDESKEGEEDGGGFQSSASSRERRAWRKAKKNARK